MNKIWQTATSVILVIITNTCRATKRSTTWQRIYRYLRRYLFLSTTVKLNLFSLEQPKSLKSDGKPAAIDRPCRRIDINRTKSIQLLKFKYPTDWCVLKSST